MANVRGEIISRAGQRTARTEGVAARAERRQEMMGREAARQALYRLQQAEGWVPHAEGELARIQREAADLQVALDKAEASMAAKGIRPANLSALRAAMLDVPAMVEAAEARIRVVQADLDAAADAFNVIQAAFDATQVEEAGR